MGAVNTFAITRLKKSGVVRLPFLQMKNAVLGKRYMLSLVFAGDTESRRVNRLYGKKGYIPNVLAFPLQKDSGEVVLNLGQAKRECGRRRESFRYFVALLFIHSLLHLSGSRHGAIMEHEEQTWLAKFRIRNMFLH